MADDFSDKSKKQFLSVSIIKCSTKFADFNGAEIVPGMLNKFPGITFSCSFHRATFQSARFYFCGCFCSKVNSRITNTTLSAGNARGEASVWQVHYRQCCLELHRSWNWPRHDNECAVAHQLPKLGHGPPLQFCARDVWMSAHAVSKTSTIDLCWLHRLWSHAFSR